MAASAALQNDVGFQERGFDQFEQSRVESLQRLITELNRDDAVRDGFAKVFARAQKLLELDDMEVARALQISRPTVGRWARGDSAPHPLGRKPALAWLVKEAQRKLRQHRSE